MKVRKLIITLFVMTLGSCMPISIAVPTATPIPYPSQIINHEKPNMEVDFSPFKTMGCSSLPGYEDWYRCEEGSLFLELGCNTIENRSPLGGLTPSYPIAACNHEINEYIGVAELPSDGCVYVDGGLMTVCHRYLIYKDGEYQLLKTSEELRTVYAPIDSPEEALSFVLASTNLIAIYGQTKNNDYVYFVRTIEDTYVEPTKDGYFVYVFRAFSTCEAFDTRSVRVEVKRDGHLTEFDRFLIYRDPSPHPCE